MRVVNQNRTMGKSISHAGRRGKNMHLGSKPSFLVVRREDQKWVSLIEAAFALRVASRLVPRYSGKAHRRRDFTQPQLLACLVLTTRGKDTYRNRAAYVADEPGVRQVLGLSHAPHYSTLAKFADRVTTPEQVRAVRREAIAKLLRFGKWLRRGS